MNTFKETTDQQKDACLWNAQIKALIIMTDALILQKVLLSNPENDEEANVIAHEFSDNLIVNFVGNFLKTKVDSKDKEGLIYLVNQFNISLNEWLEAIGFIVEEKKKEVH